MAGWVLFSSKRHAEVEIYNDFNSNLVNLFRCVKYHPEEVQKELELMLVSREQFYDARNRIEVRGLTDIQRAARFYIIIKESFGSTLHSFGLRVRDMIKAKEYLLMVSNRLNTVVIENQDFQKVIGNYDKEDTLFYLDPPYYDSEKYYSVEFPKKDHIRLYEILRDVKGKFILSYNDCEYIRNQYKGYNIIAVDRMHNLISSKRAKYPELIIKNY